jgi:hypothetical protein
MIKAVKGPHHLAFLRKCWQLFIMMLAFISVNGQSDASRYVPIGSYGAKYKRHATDSVLLMPLYASPHVPYRAGAIKYRESDSSFYKWTGTQWLKVNEGNPVSTNGIDAVYTQDDTIQVIVTPSETYYTIINSPYTEVLNDSTFIIGGDTLVILGGVNGGTGGSGGITQLTGDGTAGPGSGSQVFTLSNTAVTPDTYVYASITVNSKGLITAASNGVAPTVNANVGIGWRILKPGTQELKTLFNSATIEWDSTSNANGLTAKVVDLSIGTSQLTNGGVTTIKVADNNITYAKIQQVAANQLLGNPTASPANVIGIPVGYGLLFNSNTLKADTSFWGVTTNARVIQVADSLKNTIPSSSGSEGTGYFEPLNEYTLDNPLTSHNGRVAKIKVTVEDGSSPDLVYTVGTNDTLIITPPDLNPNIAHFSMAYFPGGWNGAKYYVAFTPYPAEAREDPHVYSGNTRHVLQNHGGNPVDDATGPAYNSDVHLFYKADEDRLYLFWRHETAGGTSQHYYSYTEDGATWATKVLLISSGAGASPSYFYRKGRWIGLDIDYTTNLVSQDPYYLVKREARTLDGMATATAVRANLPTPPSGYHPWHPNILYDSARDEFVALVTLTLINPGGAPNNGGIVYFATSTDALNWQYTTNALPYVDPMYRSGFIRTDYSVRNGAAFEAILNPQWKAKPTLIWFKPSGTIPTQQYDTISRIQSIYSLKTRRSSHYGLPLGRAYLQTGADTLDFFSDGAGGLKIADGTALEDWSPSDTLRLIRLYNQVNSTGDYISFPDAPWMKKGIWPGNMQWGWNYSSVHTNYGQSFRTNIPQGYTIMARLEAGKMISKNNGVAYFGYNGVNMTLLANTNIATFNVPGPYSWSGIHNGASSVIRRNGTQMVTGATTDPTGAGNIIPGAFYNGSANQDYMDGQMSEIVVWDDVPYAGGLLAVESTQSSEYFANADSLIHDTYTDVNATAITSHTPEIGGSYTASDANWVINSNTLRRGATGSGQPTATLDAGFTDGVVEGTVTPGGSGGSGLVFRFVDNTHFYYVRVFGGTTLAVFKHDGGAAVAVGASAAVTAAGEWTARIELVGSTIRIFLNGASTPTLTVTDSSISGTGYGFYAATGDTPANAIFDNLKFKRH